MNFIKKQESTLASKERELHEHMRMERDQAIETVIERLETDVAVTKEESEKAANNRIK